MKHNTYKYRVKSILLSREIVKIFIFPFGKERLKLVQQGFAMSLIFAGIEKTTLLRRPLSKYMTLRGYSPLFP